MTTSIQKEEKTPNELQQKCIDSIDGKFLVLAGPGTGKTFTIIKRIENMIKNKSINPEEILCLTFKIFFYKIWWGKKCPFRYVVVFCQICAKPLFLSRKMRLQFLKFTGIMLLKVLKGELLL